MSTCREGCDTRSTPQTTEPITPDWSTLIKLLKLHAVGSRRVWLASLSYQSRPSQESYTEFLRLADDVAQRWLAALQLLSGLESLPHSTSKRTTEPPTP